ncbi:hypothetical protein BP6252_10602 [Coleophoma cylindrospora]|uniref:Uncharacterized protein n=1 Tax=Coleophoma cylindrospora TaxID=1849047 RepID=A0A3D8QTD8_9HELO|nr:hypothetical protein BP6252_10602 [Coleophoma cylindrospora]
MGIDAQDDQHLNPAAGHAPINLAFLPSDTKTRSQKKQFVGNIGYMEDRRKVKGARNRSLTLQSCPAAQPTSLGVLHAELAERPACPSSMESSAWVIYSTVTAEERGVRE